MATGDSPHAGGKGQLREKGLIVNGLIPAVGLFCEKGSASNSSSLQG